MDKALKQRLVGATVLIALAVIVLPMLLGEPPEGASSQSQQIELPPRPNDVEFETRRFPLGEPGAGSSTETVEAGSPAQAGPPTESGAPLTGALESPPPQAADEATEGGPAAADDVDPGAAGGLPADQTQPDATAADAGGLAAGQPQPEATAPDAGVFPPPVVEVEAAPHVVVQPGAGAATAAGSAGSEGRYIVQVASLGSDANARKLMQTLQQSGFPVLLDTVESDTGRLSRVRVGPYDSEAAANDAMKRIGASVEGVRPRIVDLRPEESAPVTHPADPLVRWVVQVGSFAEAANAEALVEQLRAGGLTAYRETVTSAGASVHRVRVGPFLERADAIEARQQLIDRHALQGVVMSAD